MLRINNVTLEISKTYSVETLNIACCDYFDYNYRDTVRITCTISAEAKKGQALIKILIPQNQWNRIAKVRLNQAYYFELHQFYALLDHDVLFHDEIMLY